MIAAVEKFATSTLQRNLLDWYRKNARDLPWRRTKDPYKIWVSEMMLQQTQVKTVIPYYEKWIRRFPSLKALAEAPFSDVLRHWAGLGYYRRVRMLHNAAQYLYKSNPHKKGTGLKSDLSPFVPRASLPDTVEGLLKIAGIGRYTAGAIASIAFNRRAPVLDGNVIRVLTRLTAFKEDIGSAKAIKKLWRISESLLPDKNPGNFNQALMELGATVCLAKNPRCQICPISDLCLAYRKESVLKYPVRRKKENLKTLRTVALIVRKTGSVFVRRQPLEGRWGGLWMFPFWESRTAFLRDLKVQKGTGQISDLSPFEQFKHRLTVFHGFTKYRIRLEVYEYNVGAARSTYLANYPSPWFIKGEGRWGKVGTACKTPPSLPFHKQRGGIYARWIKIRDLTKLAFPSPHQKIVNDLVLNG